jgi:hypothetical protein
MSHGNDLQMQVAKQLRGYCLWEWAYYPASEKRNMRDATKLMQLGLKRHWGSFILLSPRGLAHFLVLQSPGEEMTFQHDDFRIRCIKQGNPYEVCWTWEQVLLALERWDCLLLRGLEPRRANG